MKKYPKIASVTPNARKKILVVRFDNGVVKKYNCAPLLKDPNFSELKSDALFRLARVDQFGYGVVWNDDIDISESELWLHGKDLR